MALDLTAVVTAAIAAGLSSLAGIAALISARSKVDAQAFATAQHLYNDSLELLKEENHSIREEIAETKQLYEEAKSELAYARERYQNSESDRKFLQIRVFELERTVNLLRQRLKAAGFDVSEDDLEER